MYQPYQYDPRFDPRYAPPPPPPAVRRSTADTVATALLMALLVAVGGFAALWTLFGMMATDRCSPGPNDPCNDALIGVAYLVGWGGLALAGILALTGTIRASRKAQPMFVWPLMGLLLVVVSVIGWVLLLQAGIGM